MSGKAIIRTISTIMSALYFDLTLIHQICNKNLPLKC